MGIFSIHLIIERSFLEPHQFGGEKDYMTQTASLFLGVPPASFCNTSSPASKKHPSVVAGVGLPLGVPYGQAASLAFLHHPLFLVHIPSFSPPVHTAQARPADPSRKSFLVLLSFGSRFFLCFMNLYLTKKNHHLIIQHNKKLPDKVQ